jgi:integrase
MEGMTLGAAIETLIAAKSAANMRPRYLTGLRSYLKAFARGREELPLQAVSVETVEAWFTERQEKPVTMASNIGRLSSLFAFSERRRWIPRNPCVYLERPRVDRAAPRILTVEQAGALLASVRRDRPRQLAFFTLALYVGIRPGEIERLDWSCVDLVAGRVRIDAAAAKTRRRRIIPLHPKAHALLQESSANRAMLPVCKMTQRRYLDYARAVLGFTAWPQDCMRHTAASFLLELHRDAGHVALMLGNSPSVLMSNYWNLVTPEDAAKFWAIS